MGSLYKKMPLTYITMWLGVLSLIGVYGFSGYFSKETILTVLQYNNNSFANAAFIIALVGIALTTFYSLRLMYYVFHNGGVNNDVQVKSGKLGISIVLVVLSFFAIFVGKFIFNDFVGENSSLFWKNSILSFAGPLEELSHKILFYSIALMIIALFFIYILYVRERESTTKFKNLFPLGYKILYNRDNIFNI
jgi:NADH-quinone oxidoreductase subunit L